MIRLLENAKVESEALESEGKMLLPEYVERMREYLSEGDLEMAEALKEAQGREMVTFQEAEEILSEDVATLIAHMNYLENLNLITLSILLEAVKENKLDLPKEAMELLESIIEEEDEIDEQG